MLKNNNITETSYVRTEKIKKIIDIKTFFSGKKYRNRPKKNVPPNKRELTFDEFHFDANEGNNIDS